MKTNVDFSVRNCIIEILQSLQMPAHYRVVLKSSVENNSISIVFERRAGFYIQFRDAGKKHYICSWWVPERIITEYSYEDLIEKICKYPMLLETAIVIENHKILPIRYSSVIEESTDRALAQ